MTHETVYDGGPAFPVRLSWDQENDPGWFTEHGMSLRDWFAGHAPPDVPHWFHEKVSAEAQRDGLGTPYVVGVEAKWRYHWADAMLAERGDG